MGQLLDQWMAANTAALARLQPGGGGMPQVGGPPPPAFPTGAGPEIPAGPPGFPQAAPVDVQGTQGAQIGEFDPYQAPPPPAFPQAEAMAAPAGGPGAGSAVMQAIEDRRAAGEEEEGAFPEPVEEGEEDADGEVRLPEEGEAFSAQDAMRQTPEAVDKAVDMLEEQTGESVEQHYEKLTGNPPPANMKRRRIGEFLFEFGLNLLAQPGGMSPAQELGQAATQTISARMGRQQARTASEREERQAQHERNMELKEMGLKRREIESVEAGQIERFVTNDGRMMQWDPIAGTATPVMGAEGEPITGVEGRGTNTQAEYVFTGILANRKEMARLAGLEYTPEMEIEARRQAEEAMRNIRPDEGFDESGARRRAQDSADKLFSGNPDWEAATPDERKVMMQEALNSAYNWEKYRLYQDQPPTGPDPDPARIPEGSAVPITDDSGATAYWIRQDDGVRKLTLVEQRARGLPEL